MINFICIIFLCIWEILSCKLLLESFTEERKYKNNNIKFLITIISIFFYFCVVNSFYNYLLLKQFVLIFILSFTMYLLFKNDYLKIIVWTILYQDLQAIAEYFIMITISKLFPLFYAQIADSLSIYMLIAIISKIVLLCIIFIIKRILKHKNSTMLTNSEWLCFMFIPIITLFILTFTVLKFNLLKEMVYDPIIFYIAFVIAGINIFMFYLLNAILKRENIIREEKLFHEKVKNEIKMYHSISENLDKQRKRTHEFKNQLACMQALAEKENYQELKNYILQLNHNLKLNTDIIDTNHVIINAVLNSKYKEALKKEITFILKVNDLSKVILPDTDIVIILSNLINNAMEASIPCKNKIIKLKFVLENEQIILSIKNHHNHIPIKRNGKFLTTKTNPLEHGMGISNVIEVVERYKGNYVIDYNQDTFSFSILLPNK